MEIKKRLMVATAVGLLSSVAVGVSPALSERMQIVSTSVENVDFEIDLDGIETAYGKDGTIYADFWWSTTDSQRKYRATAVCGRSYVNMYNKITRDYLADNPKSSAYEMAKAVCGIVR